MKLATVLHCKKGVLKIRAFGDRQPASDLKRCVPSFRRMREMMNVIECPRLPPIAQLNRGFFRCTMASVVKKVKSNSLEHTVQQSDTNLLKKMGNEPGESSPSNPFTPY